MSGSRSVQERVMDAMARAAVPHSVRLSRLPFVPTLIEAGIVAERALACWPTVNQLRVAREDAARAQLSTNRLAGSAGGPRLHAFWHESGAGSVVLLLNGLTASGLMWPDSFVSTLDRDHRVVRVDNRGTGYARCAPMPYRLADLADDAAEVLRRVDGGPAVVVGLSMGGMIAQELALRHPQLVERLVLVATRPPAPLQIPPAPDVAASVVAIPPAGADALAVVMASWGNYCADGFAESNPDLLDELARQVASRRTPRIAVLAQARAIAAWRGPKRLSAIICHTTVVHGDADPLMPVGNGMRLARAIPGARYVELTGVGHLVPLEAPDRLAELIRGT